MAVGTIGGNGLDLMVDGLGQQSGLYIIARDTSALNEYVASVTYDSSSSGEADITGNVTITIDDDDTVISQVLLSSSSTYSAGATLITATISETFDYGGDLIITGFSIEAA